MAPEHLEITEDMLSPYSKSLIDILHPWQPSEKLVPNLMNKHKYVCHYRNLQFYLDHGLKLGKIQRIISFTQSLWLKPWIDLCTEQRKTVRSDFESDLAKLQANATFGKTMENVRQRVNLRLIADSDKLLKATRKVSFRHSQIINSDLVLVCAARQKFTLNKPIAVEFSILELSKLLMYTFYYDHLKAKYGIVVLYSLPTPTHSVAKFRLQICTRTWRWSRTNTIPAISKKTILSILWQTTGSWRSSSRKRVLSHPESLSG